MLKLIGGEIKKLLLKPMIYIISVVFVALLVLSYFIYSPSVRPSNDSKITSITTKETIDEMKEAFDITLKVTNEKINTKYNEIFDFYKTNTDTIENIYSKDSLKQTDFAKMNNIFYTYLRTVAYATNSNDLAAANKGLLDFKTSVQQLTENFKKLCNFKTASGYNVPKAIITNINYQKIENILIEITAQISTIESLITNNKADISHHKAVAGTLDGIAPTVKIEEALKDIKNVNYNNEVFLQYKVNYVDVLNARQLEIENMVQVASTKSEIISLSSKYASNFTVVDNLIADKLYYSAVKDYNDNKINKLYLFDKNVFASEENYGKLTYKYSIEENITRNTYIFTNNLNLNEVSYNFNTKTTFSTNLSKITALDFAFYAMDFLSIFIILFAIIVAANMISGEYSNGTIRMLAIRPYSRSKILTAKLITTFLFTFIFIIFSAIITLLMGIFIFGYSGATILAVFCGKIAFTVNPIFMFLLSIVNILIKVFVFTAIALMFSVLFKSNLVSVLLSLIIFLVSPILSLFLQGSALLTYIPIVNLDFFQFFGANYFIPISSNTSMTFLTTQIFASNNILFPAIFSLVLIIGCLTTSYVVFKKKDI